VESADLRAAAAGFDGGGGLRVARAGVRAGRRRAVPRRSLARRVLQLPGVRVFHCGK
jgi:hypothetical protein